MVSDQAIASLHKPRFEGGKASAGCVGSIHEGDAANLTGMACGEQTTDAAAHRANKEMHRSRLRTAQPVRKALNPVVYAMACVYGKQAFTPARLVGNIQKIASRKKLQQRQPIFLAGASSVQQDHWLSPAFAVLHPHQTLAVEKIVVTGIR